MKAHSFSFSDEIEHASPKMSPDTQNRNKSVKCKNHYPIEKKTLFNPSEYKGLSQEFINPFQLTFDTSATGPESIKSPIESILPPLITKPPEYAPDREKYVGSPDFKLAKKAQSSKTLSQVKIVKAPEKNGLDTESL